MSEITTFRPLHRIHNNELRLELLLRAGPTWICMHCGYHLDGGGEMPCPDCGKCRTWTSGWNVERGHRFWPCRQDWKARLFTQFRATAAEVCPAGAGGALVLEQLQEEVQMLRSSHDEIACQRHQLDKHLKRLVERLLEAARTGTLPAGLQDMETWLQQQEETAHA
ncbi:MULTISPECIES: hypothetical protein [Pseudomonas]|uniref:hypothetical protein n=1 Tax=Pseudomonas TaxID=286 RepID=UPI000AFDDDBC|nr:MULTISPECIES: hypothetical protein [Pseudomonas]MDF3865846.1 hypothetical protein [Pseudomonas denitrificans (nom. rej.)]NNN26892.1 hypothetical protein [Pseudomonas nitroreducens]